MRELVVISTMASVILSQLVVLQATNPAITPDSTPHHKPLSAKELVSAFAHIFNPHHEANSKYRKFTKKEILCVMDCSSLMKPPAWAPARNVHYGQCIDDCLKVQASKVPKP